MPDGIDITGPPECQLCGARKVVASLARACEQRHLAEADEPGN